MTLIQKKMQNKPNLVVFVITGVHTTNMCSYPSIYKKTVS
jgi:hypothetical protein